MMDWERGERGRDWIRAGRVLSMKEVAPTPADEATIRARLSRLLFNPVASILLAALLVGDFAVLPEEARAKQFLSRVGVTSCSLSRTVWILRVSGGFEVSEQWASGRVAAAAIVQGDEASGAWAMTHRRRWHMVQLVPMGEAPWLTAAEQSQAVALAVDSFAAKGLSPEGLAILRAGGFDVHEVLWMGYAHNAAAILVAMLFVTSLKWVPSLGRRKLREAAVRAGRCPGCGYELRGSKGGVCPECGESQAA